MRGRVPAIIVLWTALSAIAPAQPSGDRPAAVINGEPIPMRDLDAILALRPPAVNPLTAAQRRQLYQDVLQPLIDELLLRQFLAKSVPPPDPAEVKKQMADLEAGLKAQGKTLAEYCKETQQTPAQVQSNLVLMQRWNAYARDKAGDAELRRYYAENKDFFEKTTVRASHIVLRVPASAPPAEREDARQKLATLRAEIAAGKTTFAEAAQKHSQCPSAPKGGDLGYFARKWMVEEPFARAAFSLKVNDLSDVITTDYGLHLILVTDRKPGDGSDFEKCKDDVRDCFLEEARQNLLAELRAKAKIEVKLP
jgi:parvulin-like peptidyl-prolyl isomerase